MPIVVDSSQWTGEHDDAPMASPVVWGEFAEAAEVDRVAERLQAGRLVPQFPGGAGSRGGVPGRADNEDQVDAPDDNPEGRRSPEPAAELRAVSARPRPRWRRRGS